MDLDDALEAFAPVGRVIEQLEIEYQIGGSVASSLHGFPRGTLDVDVEVNLKPEHVQPFVELLQEEWLVTPAMLREAIRYRSSFNLIPYEAIAKIDVFQRKDTAFDASAASRRVKNLALPESDKIVPFYVDSLEDAILRKLAWYRLGGHVSDQKWLDVLGMLKAQFFDVDTEYLQKWSLELKVGDLLEKALDESGF